MGARYGNSIDNNTRNPGPGDYETPRDLQLLKKSKSVTSSKFNTARRFKDNGVVNPGVGKYSINHDDPILRKKMTIGKAEIKPVTEIPPGRTYPFIPASDYHIKSDFDHSV